VIVNRTGLADVFGVSMPTVDTWVRDGCPVVTRGSRGVQWEFDTGEVAKWLRERAVTDATGEQQQDAAEIERRTKRAKMLQAELELAEAMKQVAPVDEFKRVQAARAAMVRQNVMNVRQRAVLRLLGETDEATFKRVLGEELTLALRTAYETPVELAQDDDADADADA
jgi:terminase small subunit / prophage DNA-packing protein